MDELALQIEKLLSRGYEKSNCDFGLAKVNKKRNLADVLV